MAIQQMKLLKALIYLKIKMIYGLLMIGLWYVLFVDDLIDMFKNKSYGFNSENGIV